MTDLTDFIFNNNDKSFKLFREKYSKSIHDFENSNPIFIESNIQIETNFGIPVLSKININKKKYKVL